MPPENDFDLLERFIQTVESGKGTVPRLPIRAEEAERIVALSQQHILRIREKLKWVYDCLGCHFDCQPSCRLFGIGDQRYFDEVPAASVSWNIQGSFTLQEVKALNPTAVHQYGINGEFHRDSKARNQQTSRQIMDDAAGGTQHTSQEIQRLNAYVTEMFTEVQRYMHEVALCQFYLLKPPTKFWQRREWEKGGRPKTEASIREANRKISAFKQRFNEVKDQINKLEAENFNEYDIQIKLRVHSLLCSMGGISGVADNYRTSKYEYWESLYKEMYQVGGMIANCEIILLLLDHWLNGSSSLMEHRRRLLEQQLAKQDVVRSLINQARFCIQCQYQCGSECRLFMYGDTGNVFFDTIPANIVARDDARVARSYKKEQLLNRVPGLVQYDKDFLGNGFVSGRKIQNQRQSKILAESLQGQIAECEAAIQRLLVSI